MAAFRYQPLNDGEIRVLVLHPGSGADTLKGCLIHCDFQPPKILPEYEAISYAWGSQVDPDSICIIKIRELDRTSISAASKRPDKRLLELMHKGTKFSSKTLGSILIGRNLAAALHQLRLSDKWRAVWCDSVCINQADLGERAAQVLRMGDIYRYASRVVVWLGPESASEESQLAMEALAAMGSRIHPHRDNRFLSAIDRTEQTMPFGNKPALSPREWAAVQKLLARSWFIRLWVRQEVAVANDTVIMCGERKLSWNLLKSSAAILTAIDIHKAASHLSDLAGFKQNLGRLWDMMMLEPSYSVQLKFYTMRLCECTDERDRVYAILGMNWDDYYKLDIKPNYSTKVRKVHQQLVESYFNSYANLDILRLCQNAQEPSWAPDLSALRSQGPYLRGYASNNAPCSFQVLEGNLASVQAIRCGAPLMHSAELIPLNCSLDHLQVILLELVRVNLGPPHDERWGDGTAENLITVLFAGIVSDRTGQNTDYSVEEVKTVLHGWATRFEGSESTSSELVHVLGEMSLHDLDSEDEAEDEARGKLLDIQHYARGWSLHKTSDGTFVLGPATARAGDCILVILGCNTPLVLRKIEDLPEGHYRLVGPCYHPNYMFGEALLGELPVGWRAWRNTELSRYESCFIKDEEQGGNRNLSSRDIIFDKDKVVYRDPRLGELPPGWTELFNDDQKSFRWVFEDGQELKDTFFDPRLTVEALKQRGVAVQDVILV